MKRYVITSLLTLISILISPVAAFGQVGGPPDRFAGREIPESLVDLKLSSPVQVGGISADLLDQSLFDQGTQRVVIRLTADSVAEAKAKGRRTAPGQVKKIAEVQQDAFLARVWDVDPKARVLAEVQVVMNAVFVEVDASALPALAADPDVLRIAPVGDYDLSLTETVPYIGGAAVQALGYDGTGIRVAVLDSGIDYLHANLGGSGDPADFAANDPTILELGTFPTDKVIGGYDFVGDAWDRGLPEMPDPDPLDAGSGGGHGTHVADIIGGVNGVAPGVALYAVKVCSSLSSACSGVGLIQGMEFAVDPDGDGDPSDRVDLINMSLGSDYGQTFDDDLAFAVDNATTLGVLTVAASGNGGDKPYITGTPASADTAISVAQTNVPSAVLPLLQILSPASVAGDYPAVFQPWSVSLTTVIEAPLQYGDGAGGNGNGCAAFASGSLAGKIVLVDRGSCNFTLKISNISQAGGLVGIIGLVAPGDPFAGGDGGDRPIDIPGYMVSLATANSLKAGLTEGETIVRFDPATGLPLVRSMVGSSSRGPRNPDSFVKPEIGAPGASVSAIAGSGTGTGPFGGTSGATPMVTGSAALLLQAEPVLSPAEVRARLMNTGETAILNDVLTGEPAPISRIGGGEVRVDRAVQAPAAAWDDDLLTGALNFGFVDVEKETIHLFRTVRVRNYSDHDVEYRIHPIFRFADDEMNGAVSVQAPNKLKVKAGRDATFRVKLTVSGAMLWTNYMNSGGEGANPAALTRNEYDGYLVLDGGDHVLHMPWHILPRKAAEVVGRSNLTFEGGMDAIDLTNTGVGTAQNDAYALLALSPDLPGGSPGAGEPTPDIRSVGINTFPVPPTFCSSEFVWAFSINTWERQTHLLPVSHQVILDIDQDGTADFIVLNRDLSGFTTINDGRQATWAVNLATGSASIYFLTEHATNTGNTVLYVCGEQVGLTVDDILATHVDMDVYAQDFYFGGPGDWVEGLTVTPLGERYLGLPSDIPGKSEGTMVVYDFGPWSGNTPELGIMLLTNGDRGPGNRGGATQMTEALLFTAP
jgi:subtilisin family serine protease